MDFSMVTYIFKKPDLGPPSFCHQGPHTSALNALEVSTWRLLVLDQSKNILDIDSDILLAPYSISVMVNP